MFEVLLLTVALAASPDVAALLKSADAPRQNLLHSVVKVRVTVVQADKPPQTSNFDLFLGNEDEQLVVFRDKKNKGRKFLMRGDKAWLIVPGSAKAIAVSANQRLLGAMSFADLARVHLASDYTGILRTGIRPCGEPAQPCKVVDISAITKSAPYPSGTLLIDDEGLLRKATYGLASGKLAKQVIYHYVERAGRTQPARLTVTDLLISGQNSETTLEYLEHHPVKHSAALFDPEQQTQN